MTQILGAKRTPTSVRHVYVQSRVTKRLLLPAIADSFSNARLFGFCTSAAPLRISPCTVLVVHPPPVHLAPMHAMPFLTPRSPTPLALRRPSHGMPVAFVRPPNSSHRPTHVNEPGTPSALHSKTGEAIVLGRSAGGPWMHRTGRFSHMEEIAHVCRNAFRKPVRHFVLVKPVWGPWQSAEPSKRPMGPPAFVHWGCGNDLT